MSENIVELKGVKMTFNSGKKDEITILKDTSFSVKRGEIFYLKGVSGSGKSTILSLIAGLLKPSSGEVLVDGENLGSLSLNFLAKLRREKIGIIFQNFNLIKTLSVMNNILIPTLPDGKNFAKISRAKELLESFDMADKKDALARDLSGGEQQRVAIIRALINDPDIILADEPTANLDANLRAFFIEYMKNLKDKTIIISSHDPAILESGLGSGFLELKRG